MLKPSLRWAVFVSGTGSNLNALLDARPEADVALVVSSTPKAYALVRARRAGIPTWIIPQPYDWDTIHRQLLDHCIDRVFLAGFMKIVPPDFVNRWREKIVNVHPSLLPAYPGLKSIRRAYDEHQPLGVTVHGVIAEMDAGPHLLQRKVESRACADFESAEFMVHLAEHRLVRESVRRCRSEATSS